MNLDFSEILEKLGGVKEKMNEVRTHIAKIRATGEAGGGLVQVTVNGENQVINIVIDDSLLSKEGKGMLEEMLISANNNARKKAQEAIAEEMKKVTGGVMLPGMERFFTL